MRYLNGHFVVSARTFIDSLLHIRTVSPAATYIQLQKVPSFRILTPVQGVLLDISFDLGKSWHKVPLPVGVEMVDGVSGTPNGSIILTGHSSLGWDNVYMTHDEGKSWTTSSTPFGQISGMSVAFVSNEIGYAAPQLSDFNPSLSYPYLWQSRNGGQTWHKIRVSSWN